MTRNDLTADDLTARADRNNVNLFADKRHTDNALAGDRDLVRVGQVFVTDEDDGEVVLVESVDHLGDEVRVTVEFPERDALDEDGNEVAYEYETTAEQLLARMDADGGWYLVPPTAKVEDEAVNCPTCGAFMSVSEGDHSDVFAFGSCSCGHTVDHDYLVREGAVAEVTL